MHNLALRWHCGCRPAGPRDLTKEASDILNRIYGDIESDTGIASNVIQAKNQEMVEISSDPEVAMYLDGMISVNKNAGRFPEGTSD